MTSSSPAVSICIPCYNAANFVAASVQSALNQTWRDLEVIVVDDGSTDGSRDALSKISDPRLKIVRQTNSGQCSAANNAFALSQGDFVKFLDADDVLSPDHIALQMERLGGRRDAVAMGEWARFFGENLEDVQFFPLSMYRDAQPADWLASEWMNARPMMQCALWLIPRTILQRSGMWDERLSLINDFEFFARVLTHANQILFTPGARLFYRSGVAGSLSGRKSRQAVESAWLSLMLGTNHLLAAENSPRTRLACANMLQDFEYTYYPDHGDLRAKARARVNELGGSNLKADGPPRFRALQRFVGWRLARRVQRTFGR